MKKILSFLVSLGMILGTIPGVSAASNPKVLFKVDCNTQEKQVNIGYQSNPDDPANGPEIIALKFTFLVTPKGTSTFNDVKAVSLVPNPVYTNFITAENKRTEGTTNVELKVSGGYTGGSGLPQVSDLFFVKGINQKEYQIVVQNGEMYAKNSTANSYVNSNETFAANPASCAQTAAPATPAGTVPALKTVDVEIKNMEFIAKNITINKGDTIKWTNKDAGPHTVTSTSSTEPYDSGNVAVNAVFSRAFNTVGTFTYKCNYHPSMTGTITVINAPATTTTPAPATTNTEATSITLTANKTSAKKDDAVEITAIIKNRNTKSLDWSQTAGSQITPTIKNEELSAGETKSVMSFTMVESAQDVVIKLVVGTANQTITVKSETKPVQPTVNAAPTAGETKTIQERLQERREELNATATINAADDAAILAEAENVHSAADGLSESGPTETMLIIVLSALVVLGWKKLRANLSF